MEWVQFNTITISVLVHTVTISRLIARVIIHIPFQSRTLVMGKHTKTVHLTMVWLLL